MPSTVERFGFSRRRDPNEQTRRRVCTFCLSTEFTQTTFLLTTPEGTEIKWEPSFCPHCTRRTMRGTN